MANWIEPVFDRTQTDCDEKTTKGSLRAEDLFRIENNSQYLNDRLTNLAYRTVVQTSELFPWDRQKYLRQAQFNLIKRSIQSMQNAFTKYPGVDELVLSGDNAEILYTEANLIEYCQYDLKWLLDRMEEMQSYAADFYSGGFIGGE